MTVTGTCPKCGGTTAGKGLAGGLCPRCLVKLALAAPDLDSPDSAPTVVTPPVVRPAVGSQEGHEVGLEFGPFRTVRFLGAGGMGAVYLAQQEKPIRREVALKVIRPGMDSERILRRFDSERQALAMMDHPNIAHVYDAGSTPRGRPYFVMEYVPGVPINTYCDQNRLPMHLRLGLFRQVCLAIHHAHQKGIIHRDIKPSNVLVMEQDGRPVPKVIDFGVAKATDQLQAEQSMFTEHGFLVGTPEYMSPEQADASGDNVDTATDVYSLGVLLYELAVGVLPFDGAELRKKGLVEILRIIREQDPPKPITRLSSLGDTGAEVAALRRTDIGSLRQQLRGDIEWITLRAMEKEKGRRYASAAEFAADIARHLADEPVLACPPGTAYRVKKFVRRNRILVAAALAVMVSLVAGMIISTSQYFRAEEHRVLAEREADAARREQRIAAAERMRAEQFGQQSERHRLVAVSERDESQRQKNVADRQSYLAGITAADLLIRAGDYAGARRRLFNAPRELRGWEWRYLYAQSDNSMAQLWGTGDYVVTQGFGFTSDGTRVILEMGQSLHVWNTKTLEKAGDYASPSIRALSADGSKVLLASAGRLAVADPFSTRLHTSMENSRWDTSSCTFSKDGKTVACVYGDGNVRVWDASTGRVVFASKDELVVQGTGSLSSAVLSQEGVKLAYVNGGSVRVLDVRTGKYMPQPKYHYSPITLVRFSADNKWLAAASTDNVIRVWQLETGQFLSAFPGHTGSIDALDMGEDGRVVSASADHTVRIWEAVSGQQQAVLTGADTRLKALSFGPGGKRVFGATQSGHVRIWDGDTHGNTVMRSSLAGVGAVSPDGARLAFTGPDRSIRVLDSRSGERSFNWEQHSDKHVTAVFSPDGSRVATGSVNGTVRIWDARTGASITACTGHQGRVEGLAYSPDGMHIASKAQDLHIRIQDASTCEAVTNIPVGGPMGHLTYSPDGKYVAGAIAGWLNEIPVQVWDVKSGRLARQFRLDGRRVVASSLKFSDDGRRLVAPLQVGGSVLVWDFSTGRLVADLKSDAPDQPVWKTAFSPDGGILAAALHNNQIQLWDAYTYLPLLTLNGHSSFVSFLAFDRNGERMLSHSGNTVKIWNTHSAYDADAVELVDRLMLRHTFLGDVRAALRQETMQADSVRRAALRLIEGRMDSWDSLTRNVYALLIKPCPDRATCSLALRRAEDSVHTRGLSYEANAVLGIAYYRAGDYDAAWKTLEKWGYANAVSTAFRAMTQYRLGQVESARKDIQSARPRFAQLNEAYRTAMSPVLEEAEAMIGK